LPVLNELSRKFMGKAIIAPSNLNQPIGINIERTHWLSALEMILQQNGLWYQDTGQYLQVTQGQNTTSAPPPTPKNDGDEIGKEFYTREVAISAVFFEADISKLREMGSSFSLDRESDTKFNVNSTAGDVTGSLFEVQVEPKLDFADMSAAFRALENDQVGEVISQPQITVRSGEKGRIQVGSDISVNVRDFAGNSVTQFFSTGSIIEVQPQIMNFNGTDFIYLKMLIERSSNNTQEQGQVEIRKSNAQTVLTLVDGEETLIAGLYINQEQTGRSGIPFLKDLPPWFFGLRYLFGYETESVVKKELLILVKAELLPTLEERAISRQRDGNQLLRDQQWKLRQRMKQYQQQVEE
ncbi:MAG: type II and III secretion system protein, partial [Calditrichaeota bacterium]|nr:type II and III secretion system protein [Calditrichota bacterium]